VLAGNAAASRLKRNHGIAAASTKLAGVFLIGFGIKITSN
jgi:leucine efflux protein